MREVRNVRPWLLGALMLLAAVLAFQVGARYAEERIRSTIDGAAAALGVRVQVTELRVGVFPPLRLSGIIVEKPGQGIARIDDLSVTPRFWGARGAGLLGRVSIGEARVSLPADLDLKLEPSVWEVDPQASITLMAPVSGLTLTRSSGPQGRVFDVKATQLKLDALGAFALEGVSSNGLGTLDGEAHIEGDPRRDFQGRWRFTAIGAQTLGSVKVTPAKPDPQLEITTSVQNLDFMRLFRALGVENQDPAEELGSLSGTVSATGLLTDPGTLAVIQQFDFAPPKKRPASVNELRGDFVHAVTTNEGIKMTIEVTGRSPNFIALADVPPLFVRTLLIAEDAAFFSHPGIDLTELPRAVATNWARGEAARGASTITQQLAKNLFLTREKSLHRKLKELSFSFLLESTLGKSRILEIYLNIIEWGPGLYGLRPAARHYFGKEPQTLSTKEIAFLVAMIPGPVKYQRSIQGGELRPGFETLVRNLLVKLRSVDAISEEEYQSSLVEILIFRSAPEELDPGSNERDQ